MKTSRRILAILGFALYFIASYFLISAYVIKKGVFYEPVLPGERYIPFLPWTFLIYVLVYVVPATAFFLLRRREEIASTFWAFLTGLWIHKFFWIFFPVKYLLRPPAGAAGGNFLAIIVDFFYKLDFPPINCFPSLHVTYAFLSYFVLNRFRPRVAPLFMIFAIVISISTLTFKQHYIADVLAGVLLAVILNAVFIRTTRYNSAA